MFKQQHSAILATVALIAVFVHSEIARVQCVQETPVELHDDSTTVAKKSPCDTIRCGWGAQCVETNGVGKCECNEICPQYFVYQPICASDGISYGSECEIERAACKTKSDIHKVHDGECDDVIVRKPCPDVCLDIYQPVCGSDGKTYSNMCQLNIASCNSDGDIVKVSEGRCPTNTPPIVNRRCPTICTTEYRPVCGTDGVTYPNECRLRQAARRVSGLRIASVGVCEVLVEPMIP